MTDERHVPLQVDETGEVTRVGKVATTVITWRGMSVYACDEAKEDDWAIVPEGQNCPFCFKRHKGKEAGQSVVRHGKARQGKGLIEGSKCESKNQ